ncbi:16S rRNA (uracil(1498)-N(3))-methyltransferase [Nostoc parmelioides]|uniref:Ribosomal RNA small subunit methyltransferase E n=1 Tax=Nostoc parmelioides FACHB-3921 TaxID=2692909 RepID=A0ABR8BJX9_9NOSO|nr:16S rRNA (uracil(1498)-N(3))-methyltransferase [Nostoc parmelioides]MBD2254402.1 16S rRNA (uracil(1498)-N(3))-methyltransferase [Nostoc parmelioides FACHB-3921]
MSQLQRITIAPSQLQQEQVLLTTQQKHYLKRVLRLREGDRFIVMDGLGKWWLARLTEEQAQVLEELAVKTELPVAITLMIALPKGSGFDEVVRSCTELGVACIAPVLSDRTLLNPSSQKLERWRRIASEAAEQSERAFVPTILEPVAFSDAVNNVTATYRYICEARGEYVHLKNVLTDISGEIVIAIGPEGGWTDRELEEATTLSFQPVSLGGRILRAVTAPLVALSLISAACEG